MSEAVRIERTGAHKILNSKAVYSRSRLPRIVAVDTKEEETIGDTGKTIEETRGGGQFEFILTGKALERNQRRQRKKEKLRDNLNWGRIKAWVAPSPDSGEDEEEEYMGPDQHLEEQIMLLEEKGNSTPHTQSLLVKPEAVPRQYWKVVSWGSG